MQLCCCIVQGVLKPKLVGDWKNVQGRGCYILALFSTKSRGTTVGHRQREDSGLHGMDASAVTGFT